jgi:hypothetical protein
VRKPFSSLWANEQSTTVAAAPFTPWCVSVLDMSKSYLILPTPQRYASPATNLFAARGPGAGKNEVLEDLGR